MSELVAHDYPGFLVEIKARIRQAQYRALRAVNAELVRLYWDIGESIHRKQETLGWGKSVVETLARDLQAEFPGQNGFSAANLWLMRQFYAEYRSRPILEPLVREISWAKNVVIMARWITQFGGSCGLLIGLGGPHCSRSSSTHPTRCGLECPPYSDPCGSGVGFIRG